MAAGPRNAARSNRTSKLSIFDVGGYRARDVDLQHRAIYPLRGLKVAFQSHSPDDQPLLELADGTEGKRASIAILFDVDNHASGLLVRDTEAGAKSLEIALQKVGVRSPKEADAALLRHEAGQCRV